MDGGQALGLYQAGEGAGFIGAVVGAIILLVILVLGGLYSGFFTPTEAGGIGARGDLSKRGRGNQCGVWRR